MAAMMVTVGAKPGSFIDAKYQGVGDERGGSLSACVLVGAALCAEAGQGKKLAQVCRKRVIAGKLPDLSLKTQERNHA